MSHQALQLKIRKAGKLVRKVLNSVESDTYTAHSRVYLYMIRHGFATLRGSSVEKLCFVYIEYDRCNVVFDQKVLLAFPKTAEAQNWTCYTVLAKLDGFFGECDTEPINAFSL